MKKETVLSLVAGLLLGSILALNVVLKRNISYSGVILPETSINISVDEINLNPNVSVNVLIDGGNTILVDIKNINIAKDIITWRNKSPKDTIYLDDIHYNGGGYVIK